MRSKRGSRLCTVRTSALGIGVMLVLATLSVGRGIGAFAPTADLADGQGASVSRAGLTHLASLDPATSPSADPSASPDPSRDPFASASPAPSASPELPFVIPDWQPWDAGITGAFAAVARRGPRAKVIALTIDDGDDPATCRREFDFLRANHIEATFFPTWVGVMKDPALWREIAAAGYPIGDHTLTHRDLTEPGIEDHSIRRQLADAKAKIEQLIGHPMMPVFRPPYGAYDPRVLAIAGTIGLHTAVLWSASAADSGPRSKPPGMIRAGLSGGRGAIILMHCNDPVSAEILPAIVQGYLDRGLAFVTIPELLRMGRGDSPMQSPLPTTIVVPMEPAPGESPLPSENPLPSESPP